MVSGWLLVKPQFQDSYEAKRLVEEFDDSDIKIRIIDPNEIDIFVNKEKSCSFCLWGITVARSTPDIVAWIPDSCVKNHNINPRIKYGKNFLILNLFLYIFFFRKLFPSTICILYFFFLMSLQYHY